MASPTPAHAAVIGAGAWGSTFAKVLADAGNDVTLVARRPEHVAELNRGVNPTYAPRLILPPRVRATTAVDAACARASLVVVATPSHLVRKILPDAPIRPDATVVSLVKGVEPGSLKLMSEVVAEAAGVNQGRVVALSGPNLAGEIALGQPAAAVVAARDIARAQAVAGRIQTSYFRPYISNDVIGAEVGGAVKNVIALAVGAAAGMGYGTNTAALLVTRGVAEIARLGIALGGQEGSFLGMAGMGDLIATCSSPLSRNYSCGRRIGQGMSVEAAIEASSGVVEGIAAAPAVAALAARHNVDMPITKAVVDVISGRVTAREVGQLLLARPLGIDGVGVPFYPSQG